jgi:DNA-binding CsgD family transcriptional regulator
MAQGKRDRLSAEQRIEMWRRWKSGESLHEIGRAFGKGHGSIRFLLTQRGGIVPDARRRSLRTLTLAEREDISRGIASGLSIREIANGLQRAVSTVSREVARMTGVHSIEPMKQIIRPGSRLCDPSYIFLPTTRH